MSRRALSALVILLMATGDLRARASSAGSSTWCRTTRTGGRDAVWRHREQRQRRGPGALSSAAATYDVGQIAVLIDEGDLALPQNAVDLQGTALRFSSTSGGYAVSRVDLPLEAGAGTRVTLTDDASTQVSLGFSFPFYGKSYSEVFVNSDGNVTFSEKDDASTSRDVGRLVNGPPRAAPLLADLDPGSRGSVSVLSARDHLTVSWQGVPQYGRADANTFQLALWADGRLDFVYGQALSASLDQGVVGIAPGHAEGGLTAVDFATAAQVVGGAGALAESFRAENDLDTAAVAQRFYATHPDEYAQLVVYTSRTLVPEEAFAYSLPVQNGVAGIGLEQYDYSAEYGSAGHLETFIMMDALTKYPDDPTRRFLGEDSALSVLGHEVGHLWLAHALFRDGSATSTELLGRDQVHWSFFMDTDGSLDEGNDIEPQSDGSFRTVGASLRYSALDQYLMGMRQASEVPPFFLVRNPTGTSRDRGRSPQTGVVFGGTRKDVTIADVQAALTARSPVGGPWVRPLRQAFVYVSVGSAPDTATIEKLERIRAAWPAFFAQAAEERGQVDPRLN